MTTYNLFISHSWAYSDTYDELVRLLDGADRFSYKNYSVPKDNPIHDADNAKELEKAIKAQMDKASVILILAGVYASYSKWIDKEIAIAKGYASPKKIIAIEPWAAEKTSAIVKDSADEVVGWNTDSIVSAIRKLS